jgi:hypothetical protein
MAFEEFKNRCPECGEEIRNCKIESGSFRCPKCGCEYVRNWQHWIIGGVPFAACFLWVLFSIARGKHPGSAIIYVCVAVCAVAIFLAPGEYSVVKHGQDVDDSRDEHDAA